MLAVVLAAAAVLAMGGCRKDASTERPEFSIEDYAGLPYLASTVDEPLKDELATLIAEKATPLLFNNPPETPPTSPEQNVAVGLAEALQNAAPYLDEEISEIYPEGRFDLSPVGFERACQLRRRFENERQRARSALGRSGCDFALDHRLGYTADLSFATRVRVYARLEAFAAAERLRNREPREAAECVAHALKAVDLLADVAAINVRRETALLRAETLQVAARIAEHESVDRPTLIVLSDAVLAQLDRWPDDALAWKGDRAAGLHAFEMIRDGLVLSVVTDEELADLKKHDCLEKLEWATAARYDADELAYLTHMRRIIESCEGPFYQRKATLSEIAADLAEARGAKDEPIITCRILLDGFAGAHRLMAMDRARCEAWALALTAALETTPTGAGEATPPTPLLPYRVSPVTGQLYRVGRQATQVIVWGALGADEDEPVRIRLP